MKEYCSCCPLFSLLCFSSLRCSFLAYFEQLWQKAMKLQSLVLHEFELPKALPGTIYSSPSFLDCFGDKKFIKTPKLNTIWLELIARVLNMLIGLKGNKYYSKVFKRVNYKLSNNIFWVVISGSPTTINLLSCSELNLLIKMVIFPYDLCISTFWNDFFLVLHDVWIFSLILLHFCYCLMFGFILPFGIVWKFKI